MKDILTSLRSSRKLAQKEIANIQDQIALINLAIDILDPKPELKAAPTANHFKSKILAVTGEALTAMEVRRRAGFISHYRVHKYLRELTEEGKLEKFDVNGVPHYRNPRKELRLVAGYGVTSHKRMRSA